MNAVSPFARRTTNEHLQALSISKGRLYCLYIAIILKALLFLTILPLSPTAESDCGLLQVGLLCDPIMCTFCCINNCLACIYKFMNIPAFKNIHEMKSDCCCHLEIFFLNDRCWFLNFFHNTKDNLQDLQDPLHLLGTDPDFYLREE